MTDQISKYFEFICNHFNSIVIVFAIYETLKNKDLRYSLLLQSIAILQDDASCVCMKQKTVMLYERQESSRFIWRSFTQNATVLTLFFYIDMHY